MFAASLLLFPASGFGMKNYHGRVAHPVSGAAVDGATIHLLHAGTEKPARLFLHPEGKGSHKSMVTADEAGRYSFYAPNGRYRIRIVSPDGALLYDHDDVCIYDPREPQELVSDGVNPALSLYVPVEEGDVNLQLTMKKDTAEGKPIGARWRTQTHLGEVGCGLLLYNLRRRYLDNKDLFHVDSKEEPIMTPIGSNEADDGKFGLPAIHVTAGGLWHPSAHTISMHLRLALPKDNQSPVGIDMMMSAPTGLKAGDVVALSLSGRSRVAPVGKARAKLPFVVSKVDATGTFVMARGLAWVKVKGPVKPGDILVTSSKPRYAETDNANADPGRSLGVAVGKAVDGKVLTRIARVGRSMRADKGHTPHSVERREGVAPRGGSDGLADASGMSVEGRKGSAP